MSKRIGLLVAAVCGVASVASAKTTTWTAGATYKDGKIAKSFADPNNWDNGAPEPGDIVVVNCASFWDNPVYIGIENGSSDTVETFDLGSEGLTFNITSAYTRFHVNFTGAGKIVKIGNGNLGFDCDTSHTGGTEIRAGKLEPWKASLKLGTAPIVMTTGYGGTPTFGTDSWGSGFVSAIEVKGDTSYTILSSGQYFPFDGEMSFEHDTTFSCTFGGITFHKAVTATGHTLTVKGDRTIDNNNPPNILFNRSVDAHLVKNGNKQLQLNGVSPYPDNKLTINEGSCIIGSDGYWGGTNIVLGSSAVELKVNKVGALSDRTVITISDSAKININASQLRIRALTVKGQPIEEGYYTAATLPAIVTGTGTLVVSSGKRTVWLGGVTGTGVGPKDGTAKSIYEAANWDNGVPEPGDTLVFTNSTSWNTMAFVGPFGESFDIGEKGIVIESNGGNTKFAVNFTGSGKITKTGSFNLGVAVDSSHTGGTLVLAGVFEPYKGNLQFGTGPIEFRASGSAKPQIVAESWGLAIRNDIVISGDIASYYLINDLGQSFTFYGKVTATHDFGVKSKFGSIWFENEVSAPGHVVTAYSNPKSPAEQASSILFVKKVDANLDVQGNASGSVHLRGVTAGADNALTVTSGTCEIEAGAQWGGTNIVISSGAVALKLTNAQNLPSAAAVRIAQANGAKVNIASGVKVQVAELFVNGTAQPEGLYTAAKLPDVITGGGKLRVGNPGVVIIFR